MLGSSVLENGSVAVQGYRAIEFLGREGTVETYRAKDVISNQDVTLKRLNFDDSNVEWLAQFTREARTCRIIDSPHIVKILAVEQAQPDIYIVTECAAGETVRDILKRQSNFEIQDALEIAKQLLSGLEAAHRLLIVHRDLKPENVYVARVNNTIQVKIAELGIAGFRGGERGMSAAGFFRGTPGYMAPEQVFLWPATEVQSDIYSFGVLLFEMLTGYLPYGDNWRDAPVNALEERMRPHPTEPVSLWKIVERAIHPLPNQRYSSAREMRAAIEDLFQSGRSSAPATRSRRVAVGATLGLMAGLALALTSASAGRARHAGTLERKPQSSSNVSQLAVSNHKTPPIPAPAVVTTATVEAIRTRDSVKIVSNPTATPRGELSAVAPRWQPPMITIDVSVQLSEIDNLKISLDGIVQHRATWGLALPTEAGTHQVEASAPGRKTWTASFHVGGARSRRKIDVPMLHELEHVEAPSTLQGANLANSDLP